MPDLYEYDAAVRAESGCICGVDEAGRGPLCGPVAVAAVILDPETPIESINDSKKTQRKKAGRTLRADRRTGAGL